MLTTALIKDIAPRARPEYVKALTGDAGWKTLARYSITDSEEALAGFLANAMHETGGFTILRESLNYKTPKRLRQVWPSRFGSKSDAELQKLCGNEKALASLVYNGRMGNRPGTDDGYVFRGAGYLQTTGRDSFLKYGKLAGIDFAKVPPPSTDDADALLLMSAAEWGAGGCNELCENDNFSGACAVINVGSAAKISAVVGMDDRRKWNRRILQEFDKYDNILEAPYAKPAVVATPNVPVTPVPAPVALPPAPAPVTPAATPAPAPGAVAPTAATPASPAPAVPEAAPAPQPGSPPAAAPAPAPTPVATAPVSPAPAPPAPAPVATPESPPIVGAEAPIEGMSRGIGQRPVLRLKTSRSRATVRPPEPKPWHDIFSRWFRTPPADPWMPDALRDPELANRASDRGDPGFRHRTDMDEG